MYIEKAMASISNNQDIRNSTSEDDQSSPVTPLPIYQQRENYFT